MSNSVTTPLLRFPSGRSAKRLASDAKLEGVSLNQMAERGGLQLPWNVAINYLRDKDALLLKPEVNDQYTAAPLVPNLGKVNFLLGTPGAFIGQTALQALMISSKVHSDKALGYCDFAVEQRNEAPGPLYYGRSSVFVDGPVKLGYQKELERYKQAWENSFDFIRKNSSKFVSAKLPHQFRFKKAKAAIVAMNPRKSVLGGLSSHLHDKALLIADNQANSVMRLGDVKHWGQLADKRCANDRRNLLKNTDVVSEQRGLRLGNEAYLMRRSIRLTDDERAAFSDESVSMREVLESLDGRMSLWAEIIDEMHGRYDWNTRLSGHARSFGDKLDGKANSSVIKGDVLSL